MRLHRFPRLRSGCLDKLIQALKKSWIRKSNPAGIAASGVTFLLRTVPFEVKNLLVFEERSDFLRRNFT